MTQSSSSSLISFSTMLLSLLRWEIITIILSFTTTLSIFSTIAVVTAQTTVVYQHQHGVEVPFHQHHDGTVLLFQPEAPLAGGTVPPVTRTPEVATATATATDPDDTVVTVQALSSVSSSPSSTLSSNLPSPFDCGGALNPTVGDLICAEEFRFVYGTLCQALRATPDYAQILPTLHDPNATLTVWAPDTTAFDNLTPVFGLVEDDDDDDHHHSHNDDRDMLSFLLSDAGRPMLTNILLYHIATETMVVSSPTVQCLDTVSTLLGSSVLLCGRAEDGEDNNNPHTTKKSNELFQVRTIHNSIER